MTPSLEILDFVVIFLLVVTANLFSIGWIRFRDQIRKRRMMEDFLSHIQEKLQTEEEFQEIIDKMRKDFGSNE